MKRKTLCLFAGFVLLAVLLSPTMLLSAPYYEGKRITIIVGNEAGGGYDRIARLLAKHLPRFIPGNPSIIVENMPGAGSVVACNHVFNIAKPDGLTIGSIERGNPFAQLLKVPGVKFDLRKFSWIGSAAVEPYIFTIRTDLPEKTISDLQKRKKPFFMATQGPQVSDYHFTSLLGEFAGINFQFIIYVSSPSALIAVERKEVDGRTGSLNALRPFIARGLVVPLCRSRVSVPEIAKLPADEDLTSSSIGKTLMAMRSSSDQIGRPYVAPPGTPEDVMNILRDAFAKVDKDPQYQGDANKQKLELEYVPTDKSLEVVNYILNQPEDIVKEFSKYVKF